MKGNPNIRGSKVVVMGLGVSGYWAARWLSSMGANVTVSEAKDSQALDASAVRELQELGVKLETGGHRTETFLDADLVVISPGVPQDTDVLMRARQKGIQITGELELASRFIDAPIVAVTGTNGKSTVTSMIGQVLHKAGTKVFVGGNIGMPLSAYLVQQDRADVVVAEVSSFQLDTMDTFCPHVAVLLNIKRDHLDRYRGFGDYVESKLRIFQNQDKGDYAVICDDDPILSALDLSNKTQVLRYGINKKKDRDAHVSGNRAVFYNGWQHTISLKEYRLVGIHNLENFLAVGLVCACLGVSAAWLEEAIGEFRALPHRMEYVDKFNGIRFYNDSKATNIDAAIHAIESFDCPIILIAGGRHKGAAYGPLAKAVKGRVKAAVLIGEAAEQMEKTLGKKIPCYRAESMEMAVRTAYEKAIPGDIVLLSPACSSFDMFSNYEERGQSFKEAVRLVTHGQG